MARPAREQGEVNETVERREVSAAANQRTTVKRRKFGAPQTHLNTFNEIEGFHLRWVNDAPGRLHAAQQSGYQFVEPNEVGRDDGDEVKTKELVGTQKDGITPMFAYLMKIPMEWYLEDRDAMEEQTDKLDNAIRNGSLEKQSGDGRYVPSAGISYKT